MTIITIQQDYIEISGHSDYDILGKDIVCSSISTMIQFLILINDLDYIEDNGYYKVDITKATKHNIEAFTNLIKQLEKQYPSNVKVIERGKS